MTSTSSASSPVRLTGELDPNLSRWLWLVKMFLATPHSSRDGSDHSAEREFSDVATVVKAVAARTGQPVMLFGSSWGANRALGAARDLPALRALILYEPSLGRRHSPGSLDRIEERVAAGDSEGLVIERELGADLPGRPSAGIAPGRAGGPGREERRGSVRGSSGAG